MQTYYAVLGNPIAHSKSPQIHQLFALQTGITLDYRRIRIANCGVSYFKNTLQQCIHFGLKGANVTVPFKLDAFAAADAHTDRALAAKAVNTLIIKSDGVQGDNTDGAGLVYDLNRLVGSLHGAVVLLLGAGGASQGCVLPLQQAGATVIVSNRTLDKAQTLATQFNIRSYGLNVHVPTCDIVINATAASLQGLGLAPNPGSVGQNTLCYDMMYANSATPFMLWAEQFGARNTDGFGMLVGQAAESFYAWHGVKPEIAPVLRALRPN